MRSYPPHGDAAARLRSSLFAPQPFVNRNCNSQHVALLSQPGDEPMSTKKKETHKRTPASTVGGRPARPMPALIPDTPENIAKACMTGPLKKQWRYLNESD